MLIDWFTVVAQIINFLVLVWLLKRFLYKPILSAIDNREKLIASQLKEAQLAKEKAQAEQSDYQQKLNVFEDQKKQLLDKAHADVKEEQQKLLENARQEAQNLQQKLYEQLREEQASIHEELFRDIRSEIFQLSGKVLHDLTSTELEEQLVSVFCQQLKSLSSHQKEQLQTELSRNADGVLVKSNFSLTEKSKNKLDGTLKEVFSVNKDIQYRENPEETLGIELSAGSYKISWSMNNYLNHLERTITDLITRNQVT